MRLHDPYIPVHSENKVYLLLTTALTLRMYTLYSDTGSTPCVHIIISLVILPQKCQCYNGFNPNVTTLSALSPSYFVHSRTIHGFMQKLLDGTITALSMKLFN